MENHRPENPKAIAQLGSGFPRAHTPARTCPSRSTDAPSLPDFGEAAHVPPRGPSPDRNRREARGRGQRLTWFPGAGLRAGGLRSALLPGPLPLPPGGCPLPA